MADRVYKKIRLTGCSTKSIEKAVEVALAELEKRPRPVHPRPEYPNYHRKAVGGPPPGPGR